MVGSSSIPSGWSLLSPGFCRRDARGVAPELLGWILGTSDGSVSGRIVEVEAYRGDGDEASHSHNGMTPRNEVMFGEPGRLYVYFTYGMHWCANVVCGEEGSGEAVLIRALQPLTGEDRMVQRRPAARRPRDLANGPAKLCQALGIDGDANGSLLWGEGPFCLWDDGIRPGRVETSLRIGISKAVDLPWRWFDADDENVSR